MRKIFYLLIFIVFSSGIWFSKDSCFGVKSGSEIVKVESFAFSEVMLIRNPDIEDIFLYLVFPSGEASSVSDEGLAHYVEHLAWLSAFGGDQNGRMGEHRKVWGKSCGDGGFRCGLHTGIPLLKLGPERSVEGARSGLKHEMGTLF